MSSFGTTRICIAFQQEPHIKQTKTYGNNEEEATHRQSESIFLRSFFLFVILCVCVCESINVITKNRLITITGRINGAIYIFYYDILHTQRFVVSSMAHLASSSSPSIFLTFSPMYCMLYIQIWFCVHCTRSMPQVSAFEQMKTMLFRKESTPAFKWTKPNRTEPSWWWVRLEWCEGFRCWFSHEILFPSTVANRGLNVNNVLNI